LLARSGLTLYGLAAFRQPLPQANPIGWFGASWCADRFNCKDSHQKTLLEMLRPENTRSVYLKVAELHQYLHARQKGMDIKSLPDYVFRSIQQLLAETADNIQVK
jgi:hypothetical protein